MWQSKCEYKQLLSLGSYLLILNDIVYVYEKEGIVHVGFRKMQRELHIPNGYIMYDDKMVTMYEAIKSSLMQKVEE